MVDMSKLRGAEKVQVPSGPPRGLVKKGQSSGRKKTRPWHEREKKAKAEAEKQAKAEAEKKAKAEAEKKAKAEAEKQAKAEAEKKAKAEAEKQAKAEAEKKAKAEAEKQAKTEAEKKVKAEAEKQAKAEAEKQAKSSNLKCSSLSISRRHYLNLLHQRSDEDGQLSAGMSEISKIWGLTLPNCRRVMRDLTNSGSVKIISEHDPIKQTPRIYQLDLD